MAALSAVGLIIHWIHQVTSPRTVAHATLPNGVEIKVRQTFTWSGDLFDTKFLFRAPGGSWVARYYSHEDGYWGHGEVKLDAAKRTATVMRDGTRTIDFDWETLSHTQWTETQDGKPHTFTTVDDANLWK